MQTNNKLREALVMVKRLFDGRLMWQPDIRKAHEAVNAALAEPIRNCEVGTWKEQRARWDAFCDGHGDTCETCPLMGEGEDSTDCFVIWAQMPYEAVADLKIDHPQSNEEHQYSKGEK